MIHAVDGGFVISSRGTWRPGCYESERAARWAFQFQDETLCRLRDAAIARGDCIITLVDLQAAA